MSEDPSDLPHPQGAEPSHSVERLIRAGAEPGGQVTIVGHIGPSPSDGTVRVYLDLALSSYCDIAASDVLSAARLDSTSEISPSILWVKLGAKIDRVDIDRSTTVLSGELRQNYLQQTMRSGVANYQAPVAVSYECSMGEPCTWTYVTYNCHTHGWRIDCGPLGASGPIFTCLCPPGSELCPE
jgi:hypothetical protein